MACVAADGQGGQFRPGDSEIGVEGGNDSGALLADATALSVLGRNGIPDNLPAHAKDNWKVRYDESSGDYGRGQHNFATTDYLAGGSLTTFYGYLPRDWTPEKYRFFVAHEFAHTLPENAQTPLKDRERNANEIASRITGIPVPEEFRIYAKAT